ncbi:hypothetical protein SUGI_0994880 [Cryptomeria japonica]|nr:hypothetical protein SUGI_0994880 [Cryptomeria japonica]
MDTHGEDILGIHRRVMGSLDKLHLLKNGKSFKFHVQQCQNLCNYILDKLSPYIDKNEEYLVGNVWTESVQKAWKEIYRALKEAETYLNHCSTDTSFIECFIMSNTGEAFALHMHDLAWSLLCLDLTLLCPIDAWNDRINLKKFRKRISVFFAEMFVLHLEQFGFKFQDYWHLLMACNQTAAKAWSFKKN